MLAKSLTWFSHPVLFVSFVLHTYIRRQTQTNLTYCISFSVRILFLVSYFPLLLFPYSLTCVHVMIWRVCGNIHVFVCHSQTCLHTHFLRQFLFLPFFCNCSCISRYLINTRQIFCRMPTHTNVNVIWHFYICIQQGLIIFIIM